MAEKVLAIEIDEQKPMTETEREQIKIFISHRHENKEYAQVVRDALNEWGFSNERIHQSSSSTANGPTAGDGLNETIKEFLYKCHLVIFIYTRKEFNWEWCAYEMGVAEDPTVRTRIAPFQIFNDVPKIQGHLLIVKIDEQDINKFVLDFHKKPDFFPGYGAYKPTVEASVLAKSAKRLIDGLEAAKQNDPYSIETGSKRDLRYGYFRVSIDGKELNSLYDKWNAPEPKISLEEVRTHLRAHLKITGSEGWGLYHFGVSEGQKDKPIIEEWSLERLEKQWKQSLEKECDYSWLDEIIDDIWGFRNSDTPKLPWKPYESSFSKDRFYPLVMHAYLHPGGSRDYDIYTILMSENDSNSEK